MEYGKHLYMILHPNHSLIASQLPPDQFIKHYIQGSTRYFEGKLIFVEVDPSFRNPYFDIDAAYKDLVPHEDGKPKATKFIKSYRVLENMDYEALGQLYVCSSTGDFVALSCCDYDPKTRGDDMRIILEINPVKFIVLTRYNFLEFARFITDEHNTKGAPVMFYSQLEFSVDDFMGDFDANPFISTFVPGIHPARLHESILEMYKIPGKKVKGISLDCPFDKFSYKDLRHGFMFASQKVSKFYPLKSLEEIEHSNYRFWKTM